MTKQMSVQVRREKLRTTPSFLGSIVAEVSYGDRVTVVQTKEEWFKVQVQGKTGWLHSCALSEKEIVLDPASARGNLAASSDELALAGKGFNKQVEEQYRQRHSNISFAGVDRMEKYVVSTKEMQQFLRAGQLNVEGKS